MISCFEEHIKKEEQEKEEQKIFLTNLKSIIMNQNEGWLENLKEMMDNMNI